MATTSDLLLYCCQAAPTTASKLAPHVYDDHTVDALWLDVWGPLWTSSSELSADLVRDRRKDELTPAKAAAPGAWG